MDLLERFVDGRADVSRLAEWGLEEGDGVTPWRQAREALLRSRAAA